MQAVMLPESFIALQEELRNHPELSEEIKSHEHIETQLGTIAAYCGIAIDTWVDVGLFCELLVQELKRKNSAIILPH